MKLIIVDLDGTLFDTKEINYRAYKEAIGSYGYDIDYRYYCEFCNGRHYTEFLSTITTEDKLILHEMHNKKKEAYSKFLRYGRMNQMLVDIIKSRGETCNAALVTTASKTNTFELLDEFGVTDIFDLILTGDDVKRTKPDPEGFIKAMNIFNVEASECVVFEDSSVGIKAAEKTGATVFVVKGYN